jgi:hypothetical protein
MTDSFIQPTGVTMDPSLAAFVRQFTGVVAAALAPVILVAFMCIPYTLGRHPGEAVDPAQAARRHMT